MMILEAKRTNILKITFSKGRLLISTFLVFLLSCSTPINKYQISGQTMGTSYSIIINSSQTYFINELECSIDSILLEMNNIFSTYIDSSEIMMINKSQDDSIFLSYHFKKVLSVGYQVYTNTEHSFDPTVLPLVNLWGFGSKNKKENLPKHSDIKNILNNLGFNKAIIKNNYLFKNKLTFDFSAIAKGYVVDVISAFLVNSGFNDHMIEIGGEVLCYGSNNSKNWTIGIQNPFRNEEYFKIIDLKDKAIATSGNYRNFFKYKNKIYSHTIDPKTGYPVNHNTVSVSVIADNCILADAYATALLVLGVDKGLEVVNKSDNIEAVFISGDESQSSVVYSDNSKIFKP